MLFQPNNYYFVLYRIKEVEAHEARIHWTLMKNIEVKNKHKNKNGKINIILFIGSYRQKIFTYEG